MAWRRRVTVNAQVSQIPGRGAPLPSLSVLRHEEPLPVPTHMALQGSLRPAARLVPILEPGAPSPQTPRPVQRLSRLHHLLHVLLLSGVLLVSLVLCLSHRPTSAAQAWDCHTTVHRDTPGPQAEPIQRTCPGTPGEPPMPLQPHQALAFGTGFCCHRPAHGSRPRRVTGLWETSAMGT